LARIIAIANQKGGVGKTTTAINLATSLAHLGQETLLLDIDSQANATSGVGIDKKTVKASMYDVLLGKLSLGEVIQPAIIDWLDVVPSHLDLIGAEIELINMPNREQILKEELSKLQRVYSYIIIDCPPSLSLLTLNALVAANSVLMPIQCEYYALEGLSLLINTIELVRKRSNPNLELEGVLLTMFDGRLNLSSQVIEEVKKHFGPKVYNTVIPRTVRLAEAPGFGKPVLLYDKNSVGAKTYIQLAKEVSGIKTDEKAERKLYISKRF